MWQQQAWKVMVGCQGRWRLDTWWLSRRMRRWRRELKWQQHLLAQFELRLRLRLRLPLQFRSGFLDGRTPGFIWIMPGLEHIPLLTTNARDQIISWPSYSFPPAHPFRIWKRPMYMIFPALANSWRQDLTYLCGCPVCTGCQ